MGSVNFVKIKKRHKKVKQKIRDFALISVITSVSYHQPPFRVFSSTSHGHRTLSSSTDTKSDSQRLRYCLTFKSSKEYNFSTINRFLKKSTISKMADTIEI